MPNFLVKRTFGISNRELFVLAGEILDGEIAPHMFVIIPFSSGLSMKLQIHCVEFARHDGREDVCLCIKTDSGETEILRAIKLDGENLQVEGSTKH